MTYDYPWIVCACGKTVTLGKDGKLARHNPMGGAKTACPYSRKHAEEVLAKRGGK